MAAVETFEYQRADRIETDRFTGSGIEEKRCIIEFFPQYQSGIGPKHFSISQRFFFQFAIFLLELFVYGTASAFQGGQNEDDTDKEPEWFHDANDYK